MLSIVIPCFNEEESIHLFYKEVKKYEEEIGMSIEFIFVDDGSTDSSLLEIKKLHKLSPEEVRYISFSRNFGKESALFAGLNATKGDLIAVMDVDLQDPPSLLGEMIEMITTQEYDCVATRRVSRTGEPPIRSFFARQFYKIINKISNVEIVDGARDYRVMTRQMTNAILSIKEVNRFSKGIFSWVGFRVKYIEYTNIERQVGETSWSFSKLVKYAIDGIIDFSEAPLNIATYTGIITSLLSIVSLSVVIIRALLFGDETSGWPSTVAIILLIGGTQLMCLGIIGKYLSKNYIESKNRPLYIVKETEQKSDNHKKICDKENLNFEV